MIIGAAMIVYTTRGGVSAVIWTDVVQMFVYVAGALVVFFALLQQIPGGWNAVASLGEAAGKFRVLDFSLDPKVVYTFWSGLLGGVALTLATHGTDQFLVQRLLSARSSEAAATGLVLSGFIVFAQFTLFLVIGAMLYAFYQQTPLPRPLATNDEILPLFVVTSLPHGAAGFIVAAIVAAALSPSINALAATTVNDFYLKYRQSGRRPGHADAGLEERDDLLGRRADRRRARAPNGSSPCSTRASPSFRWPRDRCSARFSSAC